MEALKKLDAPGIIVTAKWKRVDFVSRFFAPKLGVDEDPVTGSAHCTLIPYWSDVLNKDEMIADQLSPRGGRLYCKLEDTKVKISGKAVIFLEGKIHI
jgi:predicted PhzF superfamily epimerase YddE/YHI9